MSELEVVKEIESLKETITKLQVLYSDSVDEMSEMFAYINALERQAINLIHTASWLVEESHGYIQEYPANDHDDLVQSHYYFALDKLEDMINEAAENIEKLMKGRLGR